LASAILSECSAAPALDVSGCFIREKGLRPLFLCLCFWNTVPTKALWLYT
jgi:hypothetical protein